MSVSESISLSPSRRAWLRFKRNRLGYWSLIAFCALVLLSLCAELVSSDRPLVVRYEGHTYWPMLKDYPETTFGGDFATPTDYLDPFIKQRITDGGNWAVYTVNPYGPNTLNYFAKAPNPSAPSLDNWLGTDDRGRDLLAQLLYGFRVSVLFALALTFTGVLLGVVAGAIQGFFGGKTDLAFQRFIEIWGSMPELYLLIIFSAVIGSWNTMAMSPPRTPRISRSLKASRSRPRKRAWPVMWASGTKRSKLKAVMVLPEPDSPTSASFSPAAIAKLTPRTTALSPKRTAKFSTSSKRTASGVAVDTGLTKSM